MLHGNSGFPEIRNSSTLFTRIRNLGEALQIFRIPVNSVREFRIPVETLNPGFTWLYCTMGESLHSRVDQIPAGLTGISHDVTAGTAGGGGLHGGTEARRHGGQDCHFIRKCTDNCKLQLFSCFQSLKQIPSAKQLHEFSRIWLRGLLRAYALLCCIREGSASCSFPPSVSPSTQVIFKSTQSLK